MMSLDKKQEKRKNTSYQSGTTGQSRPYGPEFDRKVDGGIYDLNDRTRCCGSGLQRNNCGKFSWRYNVWVNTKILRL